MNFDDFIGQQEVKRLLSDAIRTGRIGHAYIFCGPDGIGRRSIGRCFAEALTCTHGGAVPCGECEACVLNQNGTNPDIFFVRPQEGKATVGVEDVRSVAEVLSTAPQYGKYKVILFEYAERMTVQAQNALLKTLEEPPEYAVMILICSNLSLLLDTVRSRSVRVDFKRNSDDEVVEAFVRAHGNLTVDRRVLCEYADGIIGRALTMADPAQYTQICSDILECLSKLAAGGGRALCTFENLLAEYAVQKELFFFLLSSLFRDIAICARYEGSVPLQNVRHAAQIRDLSRAIGYHRALACLEHVGRTWRIVGQNVNYKLASDALAIRVQEVIHGTSSRSAV